MKDKINDLIKKEIKEFNVELVDAFMAKEEGKNQLNIVLTSDEVIDINKITDASRVINKLIDNTTLVKEYDIDEVDIYSKGGENNE